MGKTIAFGKAAVRSAGNSLIITLPKDIVTAMKLKEGDDLLVKTDGVSLTGEKVM